MSQTNPHGIVSISGSLSVEETVAGLRGVLAAKGITLFAVVDHSGEAAKAGMEMPDTKLLIFGNPAAGTTVMLAAPSAALDLPLKILVAADGEGRVTLSWNDPAYLQQRHGFAEELMKYIGAAGGLAEGAAK